MQVTAETEITNLQALFGDMEEQLAAVSAPISIDSTEGPVMTTAVCLTTEVSILSVTNKC
ncbi:hypothetical protein ACWGLP_03940 [Streptomyces lydicus]